MTQTGVFSNEPRDKSISRASEHPSCGANAAVRSQVITRQLRSASHSFIVLLVDSCDFVSVPIEIALQCLDGFRVVRALDAAGAYDILLDPQISISAVITDLDMPVLSGDNLISTIRKQGRYLDLPVIAMSGDDGIKTKNEALQAGADAFFTKPFSIRELRSTLQRLLRSSEASSSDELGSPSACAAGGERSDCSKAAK